jgi:UDP-N-acetyl-D-mannosaminuronic acid transferase (WecB/TagA/CpsF family)
MANNKFYKIICIGGAVNMASGSEKIVPQIIEKFNLEFLWRLRTDTLRRLKRLVISALYYFLGEISLKFKNQKIKVVDEK